MSGFGFNAGMQILIARRLGEGNKRAIGLITDHQLYIIGFVATVAFLFMQFLCEPLFKLIISSDDVRIAALKFIQYRSYGIFPGILNSFFLSFFIGIGRTGIATYTMLGLAGINTILAYSLIFGKLGMPALGIGGAGMASSFAELVICFVYIFYIHLAGYRKEYNMFAFLEYEWALIKKTLTLSYPLVFQQLLSISTWFGFFLIIENLGERELAVSNIVKGIYIFWGIPSWAFGATANTMVSNALGRQKPQWVKQIIFKICAINTAITVVAGVLLLIFPSLFISMFTDDASLFLSATAILPAIVLALIFFPSSFVVLMSVSGTGSSKIALSIEVISVTAYIIYTWITARILHESLAVIWGAEALYWLITLSLGLLFFRFGNWNKKI
jgi:putative MATE family efflux protein